MSGTQGVNKPKGGQNTNRDNEENNGMLPQRGGKLDVIDENLFVQSLATCATEVILNEEHMVSKVYNLLEKMKEGLIPRQIGATHNIALELGKNEAVLGEIIEWIKMKYPQLTAGNDKNKEIKKVQKFEELFTQEDQLENQTEISLLE